MSEENTQFTDSGSSLTQEWLNESTDQRQKDESSSLNIVEYQARGKVEDEAQLKQIAVEQWIQREWVEQNQLEVGLTEIPEYNEIPEGQILFGEVVSSENMELDPPPAYEDLYFEVQTTEPREGIWEGTVCAPAQAGRDYGTEVTTTQNVASLQETTGNVNDVTDIPDFLSLNIFACLCCCWPIGLIGIIFSMLCKSAKSAGKRSQAACFSVTAGLLFASSLIGGITLFIILSR